MRCALIEEERASILRDGLFALTPELVERKIAAVQAAGILSAQECDNLRVNNSFALSDHANREGQVCFFVPENTELEEAAGVELLLSIWGGEVLNPSVDSCQSDRLREVGRPAIVIAGLDFRAPGKHGVFPGLLATFVSTALGLDDAGAAIHFRASIPPEDIQAIWSPGDEPYDRHRRLPRS
jgi:hypothetical protein